MFNVFVNPSIFEALKLEIPVFGISRNESGTKYVEIQTGEEETPSRDLQLLNTVLDVLLQLSKR